MSRKDLSGLERFHLELYSARGRATGTRNAPVRESSSGGKALVHRPFFLSLSSRPCPLRPLFPLPFPWGIRRGMCACKFAADRNFKPERISLYWEVFRARRFAIARNAHGCYSLKYEEAPTQKLSFLTLRIVRRVRKHARHENQSDCFPIFMKKRNFSTKSFLSPLKVLYRLKLCSGFRKLVIYKIIVYNI